jgi:hypothetical protein
MDRGPNLNGAPVLLPTNYNNRRHHHRRHAITLFKGVHNIYSSFIEETTSKAHFKKYSEVLSTQKKRREKPIPQVKRVNNERNKPNGLASAS